MQRLFTGLGASERPAAAVVAVAIGAAVLVADIATGPRAVLVGLLSAVPLVCGLAASPAVVRRVGAAVVAVAAVAPAWNDTWGSWAHWVPLTVVALASLIAWRMAIDRVQLRRDAARTQLLADLSHVGQGGHDAEAMAHRFCALLVPGLCDLAIIDLLDADELHRVAAAFSGDPSVLDEFVRRSPGVTPASGSAVAARTAEIQCLDRIDDTFLRQVASDPDDLALLERLELDNVVVLPLFARDRPIGTLSCGSQARRLTGKDSVGFLRVVAGRVGLALDNARLADELRGAEQQLQAILANADVAVMARDVQGRLVYANQRAADLLDLPDAAAVAEQTSSQLMDRFDVYDEFGFPVTLRDLPGARVLAGEADPPPVLVRSVVRRTGRERWLLNRATAIHNDDRRVTMAVNLIEDVTEIKRNEIAQRLLAHAAQAVGELGELESTLQAIADAAVPGLADWAGVDLADVRGRITAVAIAHHDADKRALGWRLRTQWPVRPDQPAGIAAVIRSGESELIADVSEDMVSAAAQDAEHLRLLRAIGLNSTMIVPIRVGPRVLGALSFVSSTARRFDERDLHLAEDLGRQTGMLIANARLQAERARVAHTLGSGLLPERLPALSGWSVDVTYRAAGAANEVGGDFYDLVTFEGGWTAIVGDVVGKGAEAAVLTALARHTLAAIVESTGDARHALAVLNRRLRERSDGGFSSLCTVVAVTVRGDQAEVIAAGHPAPLLLRDGRVTALGSPSRLLGVSDEPRITAQTAVLHDGDTVVLYTDGVTDAIGAHDRYGEERLVETLAALDGDATQGVASRLLDAVDGFAVGDQGDDIAILALHREA